MRLLTWLSELFNLLDPCYNYRGGGYGTKDGRVAAIKGPRAAGGAATEEAPAPTTGGMQSSQDFQDEAIKQIASLEKKEGDLVLIADLREKMGDQMTRAEFREWMIDAQANDLIDLMGGDVPNITPKQREDSLKINPAPTAGLRFYAKLTPEGRQRLASLPSQKPKSFGKKPTPPRPTIKNQSSFNSEIKNAARELSRDYNLGNRIPIARLQAHMKGQVSSSQFAQYLSRAQGDGIVNLSGSGGGFKLPSGLSREFVNVD